MVVRGTIYFIFGLLTNLDKAIPMADENNTTGEPQFTPVNTGEPSSNAQGRGWLPIPRLRTDRSIMLWFIMPTMIVLILMNLFPLIYTLFLSFTEYVVTQSNNPPVWIGFQNYVEVLADDRFWSHFAVTGAYTLISVGSQMVIGFGLAMLLKDKFRGSGIITTLILIPMMLSPIVVANFWKLIFNPSSGIFNALIGLQEGGIFFNLLNLQTPPDWLADPTLAFLAVIIVDVWMWSPFVMLLSMAGLSAVPPYLYEAASIDRASPWFQFRRITLPQVAPLLLIAVLFRTIEALKQFDLVMGTTGGGPGDATRFVSVRLFQEAFNEFESGKASALAYIVLVVVIAISNIYIRQLNKLRED